MDENTRKKLDGLIKYQLLDYIMSRGHPIHAEDIHVVAYNIIDAVDVTFEIEALAPGWFDSEKGICLE